MNILLRIMLTPSILYQYSGKIIEIIVPKDTQLVKCGNVRLLSMTSTELATCFQHIIIGYSYSSYRSGKMFSRIPKQLSMIVSILDLSTSLTKDLKNNVM